NSPLKRFDEFKTHMEITHVRREVCELVHKQTGADLRELKADVKQLLALANGNLKKGD
ncbi:unnamed protein product, partial [marine sediment metagenome]